ncbi:hypothetical protein NIES4071_106910 (plasmid) [Calothrix sp. NIES-4071]|nr:hypothetical protein NIES4071_106910 [Calothrix sp. NIES-4071]BAZ64731.1 hypothetical protein NIES4105_104640 [Calothrix sp. NIES-4105]
MLDYKPQIVHFSGHGVGDDGLILENETGNLQLVDTPALAQLFKLFSSVECRSPMAPATSHAQATAIVEYVPYVVGMNKEIGDHAAIKESYGVL